MPCYRVNFFNNLVNSNGRQFKCLQRSLIVPDAPDEAEASTEAKRKFERIERVVNWASRAHFMEIERLAGPAVGGRIRSGVAVLLKEIGPRSH